MKLISVLIITLAIEWASLAQQFNIDARIPMHQIFTDHLKMGDPGPSGKKLEVNNKYLTLNGEAILPVMGEIHPTRVKPENWEGSILKMKANGINIIAYYIFWIHHEESEGEFNWTGNKNIRRFTELCKKHHVWAYPRLGPWCHGEVRNGGLPDWLMKKENINVRTNDSLYQFYASRFYREISRQLSGLYFKDSGPIIGVQLENEYWRGKEGEQHILWLKEAAQEYGIDVPLYTVTAWRAASVPAYEVIPLWGGYPAAPWNTNVDKIEYNESYLIKKPFNDESIGHKENKEWYEPDYTPYPYFTCELGIGNQISEHRRPEIAPVDGKAIVISNLASGSNLPGYYLFTGGLNPVGKLTTLEEDRLESGYWNEYPDISYDFQAAVSEAGEIMPSYHELKCTHYFLNDFGSMLAPMQPVIPTENKEWDNLQYAFRTNGTSGFLFVSNYYRGHQKSIKRNVQFNIQLPHESIQIQEQAFNINDSSIFIWPVNLTIGEAILKHASAQLICNVQEDNVTNWYFTETAGIRTNYIFSAERIRHIENQDKVWQANADTYQIQSPESGIYNPLVITMDNGEVHRIYTLSEEQSKTFWYFNEGNREFAYLATSNLMMDDRQQVYACSTNNTDTIITLNGKLNCNSELAKLKKNTVSDSQHWIITNSKQEYPLTIKKADLIDSLLWLQLNSSDYNDKRKMYHKQFFKDYTLQNTSDIRKAGMYILSGLQAKIRINNRWVNQEAVPDKVSYLDLTGYLKKGTNSLFFDFPLVPDSNVFGALIEVEYYNSEVEYILTDTTWQMVEQYKIPAPWTRVNNKRSATVQIPPDKYKNEKFLPNRFAVNLLESNINFVNNLYLKIKYKGNKAQCRMGKKLVADNFNNGTIWTINLTDLDFDAGQELIFELETWNNKDLIYLDNNHAQVMTKTAEIIYAGTEAESCIVFSIQ